MSKNTILNSDREMNINNIIHHVPSAAQTPKGTFSVQIGLNSPKNDCGEQNQATLISEGF